MLTDDVSFSLDIAELDRRQLLVDAAHEIDVLSMSYGAGDGGEPEETAAGRLARMLSEELAQFPPYPDVLEITAADFDVSDEELPLTFRKRTPEYAYYWMRLPLELRPKLDWAFTRLELAVEFNPDEPDPRLRPTAYAILPDRKFATLLSTSTAVDVSLDGNFELSAKLPEIPVPVGLPVPVTAKAAASARLGGGLGVKTSYEWRLQKAQIDHTETGHARVFWRIDGTEFFAGDVPTPIILLQVPRAAQRVEMAAALQAYRHLSLLNASLQQKIQGLPRRFREFFTGGSPLRDEASWDLTESLRLGDGSDPPA